MGREIRRVPKGWEHPRDERGNYKSMFDQTYEEAAKEWIDGFQLWMKGEHPSQEDYYYWEYEHTPDEELHRPAFESDPTYYQIYQTVSEGSPTSPVFETEEEMKKWLLAEGYSEKAADNFIKGGWAPSMVVMDGVIKEGIHAAEDFG